MSSLYKYLFEYQLKLKKKRRKSTMIDNWKSMTEEK